MTLMVMVIFVIILFLAGSNGLLGALVSVTGQVLAASLITTILVALGGLPRIRAGWVRRPPTASVSYSS